MASGEEGIYDWPANREELWNCGAVRCDCLAHTVAMRTVQGFACQIIAFEIEFFDDAAHTQRDDFHLLTRSRVRSPNLDGN